MCKVSADTVYRSAHDKTYKRCTSEETCKRRPKNKVSERDKRRLIRCITVLRKREGNFTCKALMEKAGIQQKDVSVRTVPCFLNSQNYYRVCTVLKSPWILGEVLEKSLNSIFPWKVLKFLCKSLKRIFFNFECNGRGEGWCCIFQNRRGWRFLRWPSRGRLAIFTERNVFFCGHFMKLIRYSLWHDFCCSSRKRIVKYMAA